MKLVLRCSLFAAGGLGGVRHFLNAQQTKKVRGILASDILGALANRLSVQTTLYPSEPWICNPLLEARSSLDAEFG